MNFFLFDYFSLSITSSPRRWLPASATQCIFNFSLLLNNAVVLLAAFSQLHFVHFPSPNKIDKLARHRRLSNAHLNSAERDTSRKKQLAAVAAHLIGRFYLLTVTLATESSRFNNENGEDDARFKEIVEAIREAADTTATEIRESANRTIEAIGQKIIK